MTISKVEMNLRTVLLLQLGLNIRCICLYIKYVVWFHFFETFYFNSFYFILVKMYQKKFLNSFILTANTFYLKYINFFF